MGEICSSTAWNSEIKPDQLTMHLMETEVVIVDIRKCKDFYGDGDVEIIYDNYICTEATDKASDLCMVSVTEHIF